MNICQGPSKESGGYVYLLEAKTGKCGSCIFVRGQARKVWVMYICQGPSQKSVGHVYLLGAKPGKCGLCIFVRGPRQESVGYVYLLGVSNLLLITICRLDYGTVPTTHLFSLFSFYFYLKASILINFPIIYMYYYFRSSNPSCDTLFSERNTTIS